MSNIVCSIACVHQKEGICRLDTVSSVSCASGICPHFKSIDKDSNDCSIKSFSDSTNTNDLN